ncbi:MAG: spermidine synthase, partial [Acidobacteriota bacterium]
MKSRRTGPLMALGTLFLLSGAAALIYEVIWFRLLTLKLGGTGLAVATVTAAFMTGLGLGAWLFGTRWAKELPPILLYAVLEGAVGAYALVVSPLVDFAASLDALLLDPSAGGLSVHVIRFLLAGAVLVPPTLCMGGTLPALARLVEREPHRPGRFIGVLYGLNTSGAVLGAWMGGFILLP